MNLSRAILWRSDRSVKRLSYVPVVEGRKKGDFVISLHMRVKVI
jgi:hypothetical protein